MKRWTDEEINGVGGWPVYGPFITEKMQQILKNQNEIMEFLDKVSMSRRPNEVIYSDTPRFEE